VVHSIRALAGAPGLRTLVLVVPAASIDRGREVVQRYGPWPFSIELTAGGIERQDSVAAGLDRVDSTAELVLIHDAARPFVSHSCVVACLAAASGGAATLAVPVRDTVKEAGDDLTVVRTLDRRHLWLVQTPQVFAVELLRRAHELAQRGGYTATDDAALVERIGATVRIVPGETTNLKITTPDDLRWAEWYVQSIGRR